MSACIGVSFYPTDGKNSRKLEKRADIALYQAKTSGRDRVALAHAAQKMDPTTQVSH